MTGGRRRRLTLLVCLGTAAGAVASLSAAAPAARAVDALPRITGGTRGQHELLRSIVSQMRDHYILAIRIGPASKGSQRPGTIWLNFKVRLPTRDNTAGLPYTRGIWHGEVVTGLFAVESKRRGWRAVTGSSFTFLLPDGSERFDHSSSFLGPLAPVVTAPEDRLRSMIEHAFRGSPLALRRLEFERPLGAVAVKITATTDRPRQFVQIRGRVIVSIIQSITRPPNEAPALTEGTLFEIYTRSGRWVGSSGFATRSSSSVRTTNPEFK